jgi:hypothetical protein
LNIQKRELGVKKFQEGNSGRGFQEAPSIGECKVGDGVRHNYLSFPSEVLFGENKDPNPFHIRRRDIS